MRRFLEASRNGLGVDSDATCNNSSARGTFSRGLADSRTRSRDLRPARALLATVARRPVAIAQRNRNIFDTKNIIFPGPLFYDAVL